MFTAKLHLKPVRKILADSGRRHKRNVTPLSNRHVVIVGDIKMSEVIKTSVQDVRELSQQPKNFSSSIHYNNAVVKIIENM
jgi:aspartate carbamoyltransferase catalytic subunit